jgi:hypothetical protein
MSVPARAQARLRQRGANTVEHPGGTLYAHMCRVHDRLAALGCTVDGQLAGLTHAAYGTDGFARALLDRTRRDTLIHPGRVVGAPVPITIDVGAVDSTSRLPQRLEAHRVFTAVSTAVVLCPAAARVRR